MCMCRHVNFKVNLKAALHNLVIMRFGNYCRDNLHTFLSPAGIPHQSLRSRHLIFKCFYFVISSSPTRRTVISVNVPCERFRVGSFIRHGGPRDSCRHTACCDFMAILLMHSLKHLFVWWLSGVRLQSLILSGFYHSSASLSLPLQVILRHLPPLCLNV